MSLIDTINESWGWREIVFTQVHAISPMGHLVLCDRDEQFYYLDADGMEIVPLGSRDDAEAHLAVKEANELWWGGSLVQKARAKLGEPPEGSVYPLKPHAMVEGRYEVDEMCILPLEEVIRFSGTVAEQIRDLPDGTNIRFEVTD